MTIPEITAYVMALPVEELRRLSWEDIMERPLEFMGGEVTHWRPDEDRNQSRMVVLKVAESYGPDCIVDAMYDVTKDHFYAISTADQETRAALIAHMIHKEEATNDPNA